MVRSSSTLFGILVPFGMMPARRPPGSTRTTTWFLKPLPWSIQSSEPTRPDLTRGTIRIADTRTTDLIFWTEQQVHSNRIYIIYRYTYISDSNDGLGIWTEPRTHPIWPAGPSDPQVHPTHGSILPTGPSDPRVHPTYGSIRSTGPSDPQVHPTHMGPSDPQVHPTYGSIRLTGPSDTQVHPTHGSIRPTGPSDLRVYPTHRSTPDPRVHPNCIKFVVFHSCSPVLRSFSDFGITNGEQESDSGKKRLTSDVV